MKHRFTPLIAAGLLVSAVHAQDGWPYAENPSASANTWHAMRGTWDAICVWHSGIVERCWMVGTNVVALPSWVETWTVQSGSNTPSTVTTTNCLGAFTWGGTNTAYPRVSAALWNALEAKSNELVPHFVSTNAADSNQTLHGWFDSATNWLPGYAWDTLPTESRAGMAGRTGVGMAGDVTTNAWGWVTGGDAGYRRELAAAGSVVVGRASAQMVVDLAGFPQLGARDVDGRYTWRRLSGSVATYTSGAWLHESTAGVLDFGAPVIAWFGFDADLGLGDYCWGVTYFGFVYSPGGPDYSLPGRALPVGSAGEWRAGATVLSNAVSTIATNWVASDVDTPFHRAYSGVDVAVALAVSDTVPSVTRFGSSTGELSVTISGLAGFTNRSFTAAYAAPTQEVVILSGASAPCTLPWLAVTNLSVSGDCRLGDAVEIVYADLSLGGASSARLLARHIDERIAMLRQLRWTVIRSDPYYGLADSDRIHWLSALAPWTNRWEGNSIGSSVSWDDARGLALADWRPVGSTAGPIEWCRALNASNAYWWAYVSKSVDAVVVSNLWDGVPSAIDVYVYPALDDNPDGSIDYHAAGLNGAEPNVYRRVYQFPVAAASVRTSALLGDTNAPVLSDPLWPASPPPGDISDYWHRGYRVGGSLIGIVRWNPTW